MTDTVKAASNSPCSSTCSRPGEPLKPAYSNKDLAKLFDVSMPAIRYAWLGTSSFQGAAFIPPSSSASSEPSQMADKNRPSTRPLALACALRIQNGEQGNSPIFVLLHGSVKCFIY
jgi:hypothetical protein